MSFLRLFLMIPVVLVVASIPVEEKIEAASLELEMVELEAEARPPRLRCMWCVAKCALKVEQAIDECGGVDADCILRVMRRIEKKCVKCIKCFKKKTHQMGGKEQRIDHR